MAEADDLETLLAKIRDGDEAACAELFARFRDRLRRMVKLRMDRRLPGDFRLRSPRLPQD